MKDALSEIAAGVLLPLRKCEWCPSPAIRGADLCESCRDEFIEATVVPESAGTAADCTFGLLRAVGVLW